MDEHEISIVVAEDHALVRQGLRLMLSRVPRCAGWVKPVTARTRCG
jgi:DNA-binding NarL/FixJ family response regulator